MYSESVMELRICHLYPDLLILYGDRGNLMALVHRAQWRGIDVHVEESRLGVSPAPGAHDLYFMGGGEDRQQVLAAADLRERKREALTDAVARGAVVLAVCGGFPPLRPHSPCPVGGKGDVAGGPGVTPGEPPPPRQSPGGDIALR